MALGFSIDPKNTNDPTLLLEIVETGFDKPSSQKLIVRDVNSLQVIKVIELYIDIGSGRIAKKTPITFLWNESRDRFVFFFMVDDIEEIITTRLHNEGYTQTTFQDSVQDIAYDTHGAWISDDEFALFFKVPWLDDEIERKVELRQRSHSTVLPEHQKPKRTFGTLRPIQTSSTAP